MLNKVLMYAFLVGSISCLASADNDFATAKTRALISLMKLPPHPDEPIVHTPIDYLATEQRVQQEDKQAEQMAREAIAAKQRKLKQPILLTPEDSLREMETIEQLLSGKFTNMADFRAKRNSLSPAGNVLFEEGLRVQIHNKMMQDKKRNCVIQ